MSENGRGPSGSIWHEGQDLLRIIVVMSIVAVLSISSLSLLSDPSSDFPPVPARIAYSSHSNITITGNAGFLKSNASTGISQGSGSASDPYIIEGWDISAASNHSINIQGTTAHFVVRDCYVHGGGGSYYGIRLESCRNGMLENNNCSNNMIGISLHLSDGNTLSNNTCLYNDRGISLGSSNTNTLSNNTCSSNYYGMIISLSIGNPISNNTCSNNTFGIVLETSSSNTLSDNTCNLNSQNGIRLFMSSDSNTISWNEVCNNTLQGVYVVSGSTNSIWNNTFINNNGAGSVYDASHVQAWDDGTNNRWNSSGTPHGYGNNWSDWRAPDIDWDGIVDATYNLSGISGAKDYCPLTVPGTPIPEPAILILAGVMIGAFLIIGMMRKKP